MVDLQTAPQQTACMLMPLVYTVQVCTLTRAHTWRAAARRLEIFWVFVRVFAFSSTLFFWKELMGDSVSKKNGFVVWIAAICFEWHMTALVLCVPCCLIILHDTTVLWSDWYGPGVVGKSWFSTSPSLWWINHVTGADFFLQHWERGVERGSVVPAIGNRTQERGSGGESQSAGYQHSWVLDDSDSEFSEVAMLQGRAPEMHNRMNVRRLDIGHETITCWSKWTMALHLFRKTFSRISPDKYNVMWHALCECFVMACKWSALPPKWAVSKSTIHIHIYVYIYITIYICIYMCIYVYKYWHINI